ncbi:MAG TPA: DNA polymerase III subunit delta, partial [Vicinamibacteria bacterium]|nr:DNA polymerase III subunit delta [Vicinamibacteria bacterium]
MPKAAGVHAILGPDSFLAEEALEGLLAAALGRDRQGAVEVLHGDETSWGRLVEKARTGSLFVAKRAIVVRGADALKGDEEAIGAYLEDPSPGVTLVLMAARPDRRRAAWKRVAGAASVHSAEPKKGQALRACVADHLGRRGLRLGPEAFEELIERVGQDLRRLMGEVDKLQAWAGSERTLGADDVAAVCGPGMARPLYRLGDAIAARDAVAALVLVEDLLDAGEEGPLILGTLHRALRQMRGLIAMREARAPRDEMAARLLPANMAFKLASLLEASRRWSEPDLGRALGAV